MDIHRFIGKLPRPDKGFVLPNHKYTGPHNPLEKQLDKADRPLPGQEPYNAVDAISMHHDICYRDNSTKKGKQECDDEMLKDLEVLNPKDLRERIDKSVVQNIIGSKRRLGWGIQWTDELADELHKPIIRKFRKRKVVSKTVDDIWAADLVDLQSLARQNKGYRYLLMVIDVFSKYGWIVPLKSKTGPEVTAAFKVLFKDHIPTRLWTDDGKEFYNKPMNSLLEKHKVKLYSTKNEEKASVVERWNRTIKRDMWKYFTANDNTRKYIDILQPLVEKYNNTYHHSIKCTPKEARKPEKYIHVLQALYGDTQELATKPKFRVGDKVRIDKKKRKFEKSYTTNWTDEIFTITKVKNTKPPTYNIKDANGEEIIGSFYENELQRTHQKVYRVEKVLRRRTTKGGQKEAYVKWFGHSNNFNSWIPVENIK